MKQSQQQGPSFPAKCKLLGSRGDAEAALALSLTKAVTLVLCERVTALKSSIYDSKVYEIKDNFYFIKVSSGR